MKVGAGGASEGASGGANWLGAAGAPRSQGDCDGASCLPLTAGGGAAGGGSKAEASYVACGAEAGIAQVDAGAGAAAGGSSTFSDRPWGARVRCRAARTLCSIAERRAEYIERLSTDLRRRTKKIATTPTRAASGPTIRAMGIGADYRRSVHV